MENVYVEANKSRILWHACKALLTSRFVLEDSFCKPVVTVKSLAATHFFHDENYVVHSRFLLFICLAVFRFISSITHTSTTLPVLPSPDYTLKPGGQPPFSPQPLSLISLMHGLLYINPPLLKRRISILLGRGWLRWDQNTSGLSACRKSRRLALWNTPVPF
jgi:hypothetical protein